MAMTEANEQIQKPGEEQEDWALEILQALVTPSSAEEAAMACAAAWINFVDATQVCVVVFESSGTCLTAHGQRETEHQSVYVGQHDCSFSMLLSPAELHSATGPCAIEQPDLILCWPEHFSAVLVDLDPTQVHGGRVDLLQDISRQLLSRWSTPHTAFASPAHMEAMAEFAAGAGHEINNPLGSIIGQAQRLLKQEQSADRRQSLATIGSQAWRIRDMIGDTMLFARPPQPAFDTCDLVPLTKRIVDDCNSEFSGGGNWVTLETLEDTLCTFADTAQIGTLISHLVRNACQAVQETPGPQVRVALSRVSASAISVTVSDTGREIPEHILKHLFDPFYSGRQAGRGLGFGLCHCWQIVRMHNGVLTHERSGDRNRFIALLPAENDAP